MRSAPRTMTQQEAARALEPIPIQLRPERRTPVFGTATPSAGPAGALRRLAYARPSHDPKRWLLLLVADRLEVGGHLAGEMVTPWKQSLVLRHFARQARSAPAGFLGAAAALGAAVLWSRARK